MPTQGDETQVSMADGTTVDLAPLVKASREMRRNALNDAEQGAPFGMGSKELGYILFGMQIAVSNLFGSEATQAFRAQIEVPKDK